MGLDVLLTALIGSYAVFGLSILLSIGLWVFRDARARESDQPFLWAIFSVLLFPPLGPLYYLYRRSRRAGIGCRSEPPTNYDRFLAMWVIAGNIAYFGGAFSSPPDVFVTIIYTYIFLGVLLPVMYLLVYRGGYRTVLDQVSV
jgi:sec-independent protein translocase protein TatC